MNIIKHSIEGPPCRRMESLLQEIADGRAHGWRRWYALFHAARCYRCGTFLTRMQDTVLALRDAKSESEDSEAVARLKSRLQQLKTSDDSS